MRGKWLSYVGLIGSLFVLAGCGELMSPSADKATSQTAATTEMTSSTTATDTTSETETTHSDMNSEQTMAGTSSSATAEASASASSARAASSAANTMPAIHLEDILPLIHQATDNLYKSEAYIFVPSNVDAHTVQVEVRRDNSNDPSHSNLVALFRYDTTTKQLSQQNIMSGEWQDITPKS